MKRDMIEKSLGILENSARRMCNIRSASEMLPEVKDFDKFVKEMSDAQKAYGDMYYYDGRFSDAQKNKLSDMSELQWMGKYKSANAFVVELRKAIVEYNEYETSKVTPIVKKFGKYKYCLAREYSVTIYIKGFSNAAEVAELAKAFKSAKANEISLERNRTTIWAEWTEKLHGLEQHADEDLSDCQMRIWWD